MSSVRHITAHDVSRADHLRSAPQSMYNLSLLCTATHRLLVNTLIRAGLSRSLYGAVGNRYKARHLPSSATALYRCSHQHACQPRSGSPSSPTPPTSPPSLTPHTPPHPPRPHRTRRHGCRTPHYVPSAPYTTKSHNDNDNNRSTHNNSRSPHYQLHPADNTYTSQPLRHYCRP